MTPLKPRRSNLPTGLVTDPIFKDHRTGRGHPESPARCDAVLTGLADAELDERLEPIRPRRATPDELALCHTPEYIATVRREVESGARQLSTGDTRICEESYDVALHAAGGVLRAVDEVVAGRVKNAFCVVRPPGHHATRDRGMGFCVFNNVAVGARYARKKHGVRRALILDWDIHHGNGTQDIFYDDGSVLYCSIHQWPWYPGTGRQDERGAGPGKDCILNLPFPVGADPVDILRTLEAGLVPAADRFRPEFVFISAGFDSHEGDPLGRLTLGDADFAAMTALAAGVARRHAGGRLVSVLEGGYDLGILASAAAAHVRALLDA